LEPTKEGAEMNDAQAEERAVLFDRGEHNKGKVFQVRPLLGCPDCGADALADANLERTCGHCGAVLVVDKQGVLK